VLLSSRYRPKRCHRLLVAHQTQTISKPQIHQKKFACESFAVLEIFTTQTNPTFTQLLVIFASTLQLICDYFSFHIRSMWTTFNFVFIQEKTNLCLINYKCDQFNHNPMSIQRYILCIIKSIIRCIKFYNYILIVYEKLPYYMCIQALLWAYALDIMVTLTVYFEYIKIWCNLFLKYIATTL
jgi:hypothetical protein